MSNVRVVVRFRPINKRETAEAKEQKIKESPIDYRENVDGKGNDGLQICALDSSEPQAFAFDVVLQPNSNQEQAFERIALPVCNDVLGGYNGTIFVYGQTGSGKTFTMFGPENDPSHPQLMGVIPRAVSYIFSTVNNDPEIQEARITVSFLEIYKEEVIDLMNPVGGKNLKIKLQANGETWVSGLTECHATSLLDVLQLISDASANRTRAATNMNATSSRSHMLMSLSLAARRTDGTARVSKLHFADLAGSEKVRKTGVTGARLKEAQKINLSLTQLGQVITGLAEGKKHIPYRDSKLTHILQDSLGGNCRTTLIVNCSPHEFNREETINSLRFGVRCKLIENKATVNKIYSNKELMQIVKKLKAENKKLKAKIKKGVSAADLAELGVEVGARSSKVNAPQHVSHETGLSSVLDGDVTKHEKFVALQTRCDELSSELRQTKLENVKFEEMRVENVSKIDTLTQENEKNRKLVFEYESQINELNETKIKQEFELRTLRSTNVELQQEWKTTLTKDLRKMHRSKTKANLMRDQLSDDVRKLETKLDEMEALNMSKDQDLDRKIAKIKELLNEIEGKSLKVTQLEKSLARLKTEQVQLTNKYDTKCEEYKKLETKLEASEHKYEELQLEVEKRTNKLQRKNHVLASRLSVRQNLVTDAYNMLEANKKLDSKRNTWAAEVAHKLADVEKDPNSRNVSRAATDRDEYTMSTKTPPRVTSGHSSTRSISWDPRDPNRDKIAPALLNSIQGVKSPGKLGIGMFTKFGDNSSSFMKHRQSARMSRIVSANVDKIEDLVQQDTHLLSAHEYLAGLEKKRATLTLKMSHTTHTKANHAKTASFGPTSRSVPASGRNIIKFRARVETGDEEVKVSDLGLTVDDTEDEADELEADPVVPQDDLTRPSQMVTSEHDGFDLAEFGKLVDSNITAGLEFAAFMRDNDGEENAG